MVPSLIVRKVSDRSEVYRVEITEARYERVLAGMLSKMNTDDYYVDDSEFDDAD